MGLASVRLDVTATIEPLTVNEVAVAVEDGALWEIHSNTNVLHRLDVDT